MQQRDDKIMHESNPKTEINILKTTQTWRTARLAIFTALSAVGSGDSKEMIARKPNKTVQVSIIAMTAALYAVFFFLSKVVPGLPTFTVLYLPIILLGVFPLWFGWSGLIGSMIGAYIGGVFVESLPLYVAWAESVTTLIIFGLNWLLISKISAEARTKKGIFLLSVVYAVTLFVGTSYILWQLSVLGMFPLSVAEATLLPTFALNLPIQLIVCPALIRAISPKLKTMGIYAGTFSEWLSNRAELKAKRGK